MEKLKGYYIKTGSSSTDFGYWEYVRSYWTFAYMAKVIEEVDKFNKTSKPQYHFEPLPAQYAYLSKEQAQHYLQHGFRGKAVVDDVDHLFGIL